MTEDHVDVLVVGAGLSGICAAHYLQTRCSGLTYAIFEARSAIGGTWDLFRYPGVRSDSDMFTLGYPFRPWARNEMIADGASIRRYVEETAIAERIDRHIRFHHRVVRAEWSTAEAHWRVTAHRTDSDEVITIWCRFLFACSGYYRYDHGYTPEFPGREQFSGTIVHPQSWPDDLDYAGKQVVVIGSGATAVTIVPAVARTAARVTMLQRSPTYVASVPGANPLVPLMHRLPAPAARPALRALRWALALGTQGMYSLSQRHPSAVKRLLRLGVRLQLPRDFDIDTHFTPRYNPWDERMCAVPGGDLFKAISSGRAEVVTDHIASFTETGIRLRSGAELAADIIVTATGLELLFLGGVELMVDDEPVDITSRLTYKGMMLEGVPNLAFAIGYTNASWTLKCDLTCRYVCRVLDHMNETGLRQCVPRNEDASVVPAPLLDLQSGYIRRAVDRMPRQGSKFPWRVYQSYLQDYRAMTGRDVADGVLQFSNPARLHAERAS